jgi:hypothetical protein
MIAALSGLVSGVLERQRFLTLNQHLTGFLLTRRHLLGPTPAPHGLGPLAGRSRLGRLRSRVHVLEGLLEIKSELIDRQREELQTLHASTRGSALVLEHVRLCLRELRVCAQSNQIATLNELEGVLLETLLAA